MSNYHLQMERGTSGQFRSKEELIQSTAQQWVEEAAAQQPTEQPAPEPESVEQQPEQTGLDVLAAENQAHEEDQTAPAAAEQPSAKRDGKRLPGESFAEMRQRMRQIEQERDEARRLLLEQQARQQQYEQQIVDEQEEELAIAPDDLAEGKHISKVQKKIKALEQKLSMYEQRSTEMALEAQLRARYPDFEKIVSPENIALLRETEPEIAATISSSPDLYSKAVSAYTMIKKLGIYKEPVINQDQVRAQKNMAKPRSLASVAPQYGDSPLSRANAFANGLTKEVQQKLLQEMVESMKNR